MNQVVETLTVTSAALTLAVFVSSFLRSKTTYLLTAVVKFFKLNASPFLFILGDRQGYLFIFALWILAILWFVCIALFLTSHVSVFTSNFDSSWLDFINDYFSIGVLVIVISYGLFIFLLILVQIGFGFWDRFWERGTEKTIEVFEDDEELPRGSRYRAFLSRLKRRRRRLNEDNKTDK